MKVRKGTKWEKIVQESEEKDACQRSTVFWLRIFLRELQNGLKDVIRTTITAIIQKSFLWRSNATPAERLFVTLLYLAF